MRRIVTASFVVPLLVASLRADTIELVNGDTLSGKIVSLDDEELTLESELLGRVALERRKVAAIYFGDRKPVRTAEAPAARTRGTTGETAATSEPQLSDPNRLLGRLLGEARGEAVPGAGGGPTVEDIVGQLQRGKVDPKSITDVRRTFPLLAQPEAQKYFNETLGGLMTGKTSIQDVRKDAVRARDLIDELQQDLGPQGAALNHYRSILDKFIRETEPETKPAPRADP